MRDALRYEWTRITTLRSTWWLTGGAVLLGTAVAVLIALAARSQIGDTGPSAEEARQLPSVVVSQGSSLFVPNLVAFLAGMIAVFAWGHEYRHGMIRATLTAVPVRPVVWVAKFVVVGVWVCVLSAVTGFLSLLLGALALSGSGVDVVSAESVQMLGRCVVYTLVLSWLVEAFAAVVRQQVVALVLMFLWPFVLENVISGIVLGVPALRERFADAVRFLPFDAGNRIIRQTDLVFTENLLNPWQGFAVFAATCVLLMAASFVLFRKRDA